MTREEAKEYLINISYKLGSMSIEYLTEKDGEKMREAIHTLESCEEYITEIDHLRKYISKLETQIVEKENADGCCSCAFEDVEEWKMPCSKCKRGCKDYWRPKKEN